MHGLGDDEAEVMVKAIRKSLTPVRDGIGMIERGLHPDLAIANLNWTDRHVVRPQVECATASKIEAGMVPMTSQNAVLNAAALKRKTHVRTTIVQGENAPPIVDDEDRTMATVHNEPALCLQIVKAPSERKFLVRCVHKLSAVASSAPLWRPHRLP